MYGIKDPAALLQPWRNLKEFTEELYSMFSTKAAPQGKAPQPAPAETIPRDEGSHPVNPAAGRSSRDAEADAAAKSNPVRAARIEASRARTAPPALPASDSHHGTPRTPPADDQAPRRAQEAAVPNQQSSTQPLAPKTTRESHAPTQTPSVAPAVYDEGDHAPSTRRVVGQSGNSPAQPEPPAQRPPTRAFSPSSVPEFTAPAASHAASRPTPRPEEPSQSQEAPRRPKIQNPDDPRRNRVRVTPPYKSPMDIGDFAEPLLDGGSSTIFMGTVTSGTGDTYMVTTYSSGPGGEPDSPDVQVTIPMIDPTDTIAPGTWLACIFQFADSDGNDTYYSQPPVWM